MSDAATIGADGWDGDTIPIAAADSAGHPAVVQLVGREPKRRSVTVVNPDNTRTLRACPNRDKATRAGKGVSIPPGVAITISTVAPVYVANDDDTAGCSVVYFMELDS